MSNRDNMSEEDYLDSLLRAVSTKKNDEFDIDKDLDIDAEFEAEFEAELAAELEQPDSDIKIEGVFEDKELAESNTVFADKDDVEDKVEEESLDEDITLNEEMTSSEEAVSDEEITSSEDIISDEEIFPAEDTSFDETDLPAEESVSNEIDLPEENIALDEVAPSEENSSSEADVAPNDVAKVAADITEDLLDILKDNIAEDQKKQKKGLFNKSKKDKKEKKNKKNKNNKNANSDSIEEAFLADTEAMKVNSGNGKTTQELLKGIAEGDDDYVPVGKTPEEKTIDNSVEDELAELGLDGLFGEMPEPEIDMKEEIPALNGYEEDSELEVDDKEDDEEKGDSKKKKKEKKSKADKPKKVKKPKEKKPKKPKKPKEPDVIIPFSKGGIILSISFVALVVVGLTLGGQYYNYNKSMERAIAYYIEDNYEAAYRELSGLDIRKGDEFFLEQVKVVMTVETNYDSFKSLMRLGLYEDALDSLLKGVESFDLYQNRAREWDAFDDLETAFRRVVNALNTNFGITESEAREVNLIESQREYSIRVYELAKNVRYDSSLPFEDETTTEQPTSEDETTVELTTSEGETTEEVAEELTVPEDWRRDNG